MYFLVDRLTTRDGLNKSDLTILRNVTHDLLDRMDGDHEEEESFFGCVEGWECVFMRASRLPFSPTISHVLMDAVCDAWRFVRVRMMEGDGFSARQALGVSKQAAWERYHHEYSLRGACNPLYRCSRNTIANCPFDAPQGTNVLQRILPHNDEIRPLTYLNCANLALKAEHLCADSSRGLENVTRGEAGFF